MSLPSPIKTAVLDTILVRLAGLFLSGAGGDLVSARHAAARMLAGYQPESADELRLAAEIISFSFHALEALSQATSPDMPMAKVLRLRGNAVRLSRESNKAEDRLAQLQKARRAASAAEAAQASAENFAAAEANGKASPALSGYFHDPIWTHLPPDRQTAKRVGENSAKHQVCHAGTARTLQAATSAGLAQP